MLDSLLTCTVVNVVTVAAWFQAKGNNRGGAVVEFFGAHEFALLKPDALKPLSTLDKSPNKSVSCRVLFFYFYRKTRSHAFKECSGGAIFFSQYEYGIFCEHHSLWCPVVGRWYRGKFFLVVVRCGMWRTRWGGCEG